MGKRVIDLQEEELKKIHLEALEEFKELFTPVIEKYSDIQMTTKELAEHWKCHVNTITKYTEVDLDPLPVLKNGKISLKEACEWLYSSRWVQQTTQGKKLYDKIITLYDLKRE